MSTLYCGRAVPAALRRFRVVAAETLCRKAVQMPADLPDGFHLVLLMTKSRHANLREGWAAGHVQLSDVVKAQAEAAGIDLPAPRLDQGQKRFQIRVREP